MLIKASVVEAYGFLLGSGRAVGVACEVVEGAFYLKGLDE